MSLQVTGVGKEVVGAGCVLIAGLTGLPDGLNTEGETKKEFKNDSEIYSPRHGQLREQSSSYRGWE